MRPLPLLLLITALPAPAAQPPVFDIRAFGAREFKDDDHFKSTRAIAKAIDEATHAPGYDKTGCIIQIPKGKWLTGPIELRSNLTLRIDKDSTLLFSADPEDDPPAQLTRWEGIECVNYTGYIRARGARNIAIAGKGTIDANGRGWWRAARMQDTARQRLRDLGRSGGDPNQRKFASMPQWPDPPFDDWPIIRDQAHSLRPSFIQFLDCQNIRLEGFTIRNVPMYAIHPIYCEDVACNDLYVVALGPDGDGVVPDSSKRLTITNSTFDCYEDGVSIKSGRDADGLRVNRPCEDVTVKGCTFIRGASAVAIGSETSGSIRRVTVTQCLMKGVGRGLRIKTMPGRGGEISDVKFTLCRLYEIADAGMVIDAQFNPANPDDFSDDDLPKIGKILVWGVDCDGGSKPWLVRGLPKAPVVGLTVADVKLRADRGIESRHVNGAEVKQVEVAAKEGWSIYANDVQDWYVERLKPLKAPENGAVIALRDANSVTFNSIRAPEDTDVFLRIAGKNSSEITLNKCDTRDAAQRVKFEDGATDDAIKQPQ
jgi:polygalacturonase